MPLTPVKDIAKLAPGIETTLDENGFYTMDTEQLLLESYNR
jgi:hypothetical protein